MAPAVIFRLAQSSDLPAIWEVFRISFNDMVLQVHGRRSPSHYSKDVPPYLSHVLGTDPRSFWVAECQGRVVGFACAIVRRPIWFLCDFWILPKFRHRGIGQKLLKCSRQSSKAYRILSTYSSLFPAAMRSYILLGMIPRFPIYTLVAESKELKLSGPSRSKLEWSEIDFRCHASALPASVHALGTIDRQVRGCARPEDHTFFLTRSARHGWVGREAHRPAGYFYITKKGQIGPLASLKQTHKIPLLREAVGVASQLHPHITLHVPGSNADSMRTLLAAGFRIESHALFMSSAEFGKLENYIISGPALF